MAYQVVQTSQPQNYPLVPAQSSKNNQLVRWSTPQELPMVLYTPGTFAQKSQRLQVMSSSLRNLSHYPMAIMDPKMVEMCAKLAKQETDRIRHMSNVAALGLLKVMESIANCCKSATNKMGALAARGIKHLVDAHPKEASALVVRTVDQKLPPTTLICQDSQMTKKRVEIHFNFSAPLSKLPLDLRLRIRAV